MQHILWAIVEKRLALPLALYMREWYNEIIEVDNRNVRNGRHCNGVGRFVLDIRASKRYY
jgi:hypothetical protein